MIVRIGACLALTGCSVLISDECKPSSVEAATIDPGEPYRCADRYQNHGDGCGEDGYALGYGAKYAEKFMWETYETVEPETQAFLVRNLICLQERFIYDTTTEMTCDELWGLAIASHVDCYIESGVCELSTTELLKVFSTVDQEDIGTSEALDATGAIWDHCWG